MLVPNWLHHSKKHVKMKKKPRALSASRARLKALKYKLSAKRHFHDTIRKDSWLSGLKRLLAKQL